MKYQSLFSWENGKKIGCDNSCKLSLKGSLHEISKSISCEKYFKMLSTEFNQGVVKVNSCI